MSTQSFDKLYDKILYPQIRDILDKFKCLYFKLVDKEYTFKYEIDDNYK